MGHTVRLIAAQFVKPYVKTNKNDAAAAEAICEALSRPGMRFVPVKLIGSHNLLALRRARQGFVKERTAQANQIRGFLSEFGIVIPQGIRHIERCLPSILEDAENELAVGFRQLLARLMEHLRERYRQVEEIEAQIKRRHQDNDASCKLTAIPGIGP
jgi:transposase